MIVLGALRPQEKWNLPNPCPGEGRPRGEIVISPAQNHFGGRSCQSGPYSGVQQCVVLADPPAPRRKNLIRKLNLFLEYLPLTQGWVGFGQEDDMQIYGLPPRECIEQRNAVGRDDLGQND